jgi:hypothetical protein
VHLSTLTLPRLILYSSPLTLYPLTLLRADGVGRGGVEGAGGAFGTLDL